jgi:uridine kinase
MINFDEAVAIASRSGAKLIAIDGLPVSGKSTLAERFEAELAATTLYLDDFVRPEREWRGQIGPAFPFDYIRYAEYQAAVETVARGEAVRYRLYDWSLGKLSGERVIEPGGVVVVEGVSALHPALTPLYDLKLWVQSDASTTLSASLARGVGNWEMEWRNLFLPSVDLYMATDPRSRADHIVAGRGAL